MKVLSSIAGLMASQYAIDIQQAEEFLGGIIYGLIQKDDLKAIETCLKDADTVEKEVNEAVTDFMKGDLNDILAGITVLGQLIQELPQDLGDCQAIQGDIDRIEKWASIFSDPKQLMTTVVENLIKHYGAIFKDIDQTSADIGKADFYTAGADVADILVLTLGAVPEAQTPDDLQITQWWSACWLF